MTVCVQFQFMLLAKFKQNLMIFLSYFYMLLSCYKRTFWGKYHNIHQNCPKLDAYRPVECWTQSDLHKRYDSSGSPWAFLYFHWGPFGNTSRRSEGNWSHLFPRPLYLQSFTLSTLPGVASIYSIYSTVILSCHQWMWYQYCTLFGNVPDMHNKRVWAILWLGAFCVSHDCGDENSHWLQTDSVVFTTCRHLYN